MRKEPIAIISVLVLALVWAGGYFGVQVTEDEQGRISETIAVVFGGVYTLVQLIATIWARSKVSPVAKAGVPTKTLGSSIVIGGLLLGCNQVQQAVDYAQQNPGDTAEFLAQQACARHYAAQRKIDLEAAQQQFCAVADQWMPWLKPIVDALAKGEERAMARDSRAE